MNILNTICGTVIGVYTGKKLLDYINEKQNAPPKYNCVFLYNQKLPNPTNKPIISYLDFFIDFVNEAQHSLDICFFLITYSRVVDAIIAAKKRKINVRIITDYHMGINDNFYMRQLFKEGFRIYFDMNESSKFLMHQKFAIRDGDTVCVGSVNLTEAASAGSYDNVIITQDPEFLLPFKKHFQELVELLD